MSDEFPPPFTLVPDFYGRLLSYTFDAVNFVDIYTVGSLGPPTPAFNVSFPSGTAESTVYDCVNGIPPDGSGGLVAANPGAVVTQTSNCGGSVDRPSAPGMGIMYFDTDLGIPVWWVGHGSTGWVNGAGDSV